ncbi:hypothetical protein [uncultured Ruegeria sp.]|uniref:hypothetical protein n=1 Tax=uncultured Ruegeria sp. TaxID=259304 RepID=UPI0026278AD0|nr:hypothetical protein [uncultured Ruegeria sp.]
MVSAALGMMIATLVLTLMIQGELRKAQLARNLARAEQVAEIAALFDLYVHENRVALAASIAPLWQRGRATNAAERAGFEAWADGAVNWDIPGFDLSYLVLDLSEIEFLSERIMYSPLDTYGLLLLRAVEDPVHADLDGLLDALEARGLNSGRKGETLSDRLIPAAARVENILGRSLGNDEAAILTASLSGVSEEYMLRQERVGHPEPGFSDANGTFDLGSNSIIGTDRATADSATVNTVTGRVEAGAQTGSVEEVTGALTLDGEIAASSLLVSTSLGVGTMEAPSLQAAQVTVAGPVVADTISATAGPVSASHMFTNTATVRQDITWVWSILASDVLAEDHLSVETANVKTLAAKSANIQHLKVSGSCAGC